MMQTTEDKLDSLMSVVSSLMKELKDARTDIGTLSSELGAVKQSIEATVDNKVDSLKSLLNAYIDDKIAAAKDGLHTDLKGYVNTAVSATDDDVKELRDRLWRSRKNY